MASFHLTLPSNSSKNVFPENSLHTFQVQLRKTLPTSQGKWEVGLCEIQFPKSWYNVTNAWMEIHDSQRSNSYKLHLKDGFYPTINDLLEHIQEIITGAKLHNIFVFTYLPIQQRVKLEVYQRADRSSIQVAFSQNLLNILGFSKNEGELYNFGHHILRHKPADINEGFSSLYVYSDIVENQLVGDHLVPLLRVVSFENDKKREQTSVSFQHIQYIPVLKRQTDTIEINIRRDNGDIIPFQQGKVVLTLHFRQVQ
jgi:hypothetical protein